MKITCPICNGKSRRCLVCEGKGVVDTEKLDEKLEQWTDTQVTFIEVSEEEESN